MNKICCTGLTTVAYEQPVYETKASMLQTLAMFEGQCCFCERERECCMLLPANKTDRMCQQMAKTYQMSL